MPVLVSSSTPSTSSKCSAEDVFLKHFYREQNSTFHSHGGCALRQIVTVCYYGVGQLLESLPDRAECLSASDFEKVYLLESLSAGIAQTMEWCSDSSRFQIFTGFVIGQRFGAASIAHLRWYGQVIRANGDTVLKISLKIRAHHACDSSLRHPKA